MEILRKDQNKQTKMMKFWQKLEILAKASKFWKKMEILAKTSKF